MTIVGERGQSGVRLYRGEEKTTLCAEVGSVEKMMDIC